MTATAAWGRTGSRLTGLPVAARTAEAAYPLYDQYIGDVYEGASGTWPTGKKVFAYKPVGVCFDQWLG